VKKVVVMFTHSERLPDQGPVVVLDHSLKVKEESDPVIWFLTNLVDRCHIIREIQLKKQRTAFMEKLHLKRG
jgi:hypothetical protein